MATIDTSKFVKWVLTNYESYHAMDAHDNRTFYYLEDTHELYKGDDNAASSVVKLANAEPFPDHGGDRLFIKDGKFYMQNATSLEWEEIVVQATGGTVDVINPNDLTGLPVTDKAVADFVGAQTGDSTTVRTTEDINVTNGIGEIEANTVIAKGTTLQSILTSAFTKPKVWINPALVTSFTGAVSSIEVGKTIPNITVNSTFNKNDGGELNNYKVQYTGYNGTSADVYTGATIPTSGTVVAGLTPSSEQTVVIKAVASYDANADRPDKVPAGSVTKSTSINVYRNLFYAADTRNDDELVSNNINTLTAAKASTGNVTVTCPAGATRVIFAVPSNKVVTAVVSNNTKYSVLETFESSVVSVETTSGNFPMDYNVYVYKTNIAFPAEDKYIFTVSAV